MKELDICAQLNLNPDEIVNIYPYGSRVYGSARPDSDHDFIIVYKRAILESGSFKDNAISSLDKSVQGSSYSRGGFQDAINNYVMTALEAVSLDESLVIKKKWPFKSYKYDEAELIKNVIKQSSNSWHISHRRWVIEHKATTGEPSLYMDRIKKGIWHSLRILMFGTQFKMNQKIVNFSEANELLDKIMADDKFDPRKYLGVRDRLTKKLKGEQ